MPENFELKLVIVHWQSKDHFGYIDKISRCPIKVIKQEEKIFTADIPSYPLLGHKHSQIALRCKSTLNSTPKVLQDNDTKDLFPLSDPKNGKWWIQKGDWIKKYKYHDAPSCRFAGLFTIIIGDITVRLNITPSGFTPLEYQGLLDSFKGELWLLIFEKNSTLTISKDGKEKLPGDEFQRKVGKFIKFADQVLGKPNEELRERQEIQRIEKVRPTAKTYMELSTIGTSIKFVTGRGYKPSYNTPDNKYIADIINRLILIVRNLKKGVESSKKALEYNVLSIQKKLLQEKDYILKFDSSKLDAEIKQAENIKHRWDQKKIEFENYFSQQDKNSNDGYQENISFTVGSSPKINTFNSDYIDVWYKTKPVVLKFPCDSCDIDFFKKKTTYRLSNIQYKNQDSKDGKTRMIYIKKISSVEILEDKSDKIIISLKKDREKYSKTKPKWTRPLNPQEISEKNRELSGMRKREEMLVNVTQKYYEKLTNLNLIYKNLLQLNKKCKALSITVENRLDYPGTMTFIQNPSYRGAYSSFKEIQKEAHFETLFDSLLTIEEFGVTDQPNIYEKWCLLQIINILHEYGFVQDEGWITKLVTSISREKYLECSFVFKHPSLSQSVKLIYQPTLANGKTPDFMLKIQHSNGETILILDAKNKKYNLASQNFLSDQVNTFSLDLDNLVNEKNYTADGSNSVFILHPMKDKGFLPVLPTPQNWSYCSTLGGSSVFDWEDTNFGPEHKYGGVQVRPENLDNLKMIIAMALQYLTEDNHYVNTLKPKNKEFCIICGGTEFDDSKKCETQGSHYTCRNCHHFFIRHFCGCGNRIWKHGSYWIYHDTLSTEPYNIKCPKCGDFYREIENKS